MPGLPAPSSVEELRERVAALAGNRSVAVGDQDIIDPQGKDDDAYRLMARQEVPPLARIAGALFGMPSGEVAAYDAAADAAAFSFDGEARGPLDDTRTRPRGRREA
jgi:low molecular weight protein-tyrosine phosphatase